MPRTSSRFVATRPRVLCVGEIIWDIIEGREHLGGAPSNVAVHAAGLGAEAAVWSAVGTDRRGRQALRMLRRRGVRCRWIFRDPKHPTGWARVQLDAQGCATYVFAARPAYDFLDASPAVLDSIANWQPHAVVFGTLAQRGRATRRAVGRLLRRCSDALRIFDVNLRRGFAPADLLRARLRQTDVLKVNEDEAQTLARLLWARWPGDDAAARRWREQFGIDVVVVTRGADGASVWSSAGRHDEGGIRVKVADTVGSGDAFTAAFTVSYLRTQDVAKALHVANRLGAFVASRPGATPVCPPRLRKLVG